MPLRPRHRGLLLLNINKPLRCLRRPPFIVPDFLRCYTSTTDRNEKILEHIKHAGEAAAEDDDVDIEYNYQLARDLNIDPAAKDHIVNKLKPISPSDLYVSCTTFDGNGKIAAVSQKYPKMAFLKENHLFPRDLRKIDTSTIDVVPLIMIRPSSAILINLLHIKAIIKKDSVKVFDTSTPSIATKLGLFMYDLELKLKLSNRPPHNAPYEFRALESILISVMGDLETELTLHVSSCGLILSELEDQIDRNKLQDLLIKLKKLSSFYQKAVLIRDVLEEILDNDEDLAGMYLTNPQIYDANSNASSDELEMILESYYKQCDEFVQQAGSLINDIKATEEIVNIILDANRNSLMLFELKVTVYTLGFTVATLVPAFYGMNLKNYIEDSNLGFGAVVVFSVILGFIITALNFKTLRKVQRLTMMGTQTPKPAGQLDSKRLAVNRGWLSKQRWYKMLYGNRTKYDRPTSKEKDVIWRMINDDKTFRH